MTYINKPQTTARNLTDDALQSAQSAVESTRAYANDTLDRAGEKVRDLRREAEPAINRLTAKAQDYATKGYEFAADTSAQAKEKLQRYADVTGRYVADQPVKSVLIAAAAGAAIAAAILIATRNSNNRNRY